METVRTTACCAACVHFERGALALERALPGLRTLGSGFASVRADDGLCRRHERYLSAHGRCADFSAARRAVR